MKLLSMEPQFVSTRYIIWEITTKCNYNCSYCTFINKKNIDVTYTSLLKILDNLSNSKYVFDIDFIGGEPTIYPQYLDILEETVRRLPNSNIYTTTNASQSLNFFKKLHNRLQSYDKSKIRFYFSYHMQYTNLDDYIEKVNFLGERGYPVYIKFVCDNTDLERVKYIHSKLVKTKFDKLFLKYLWNYRQNNLYESTYIDWINKNTVDNEYLFNVSYIDDDILKTDILNYKQIKKYNFDLLNGYNCYVNRLLYINTFGQVHPSCLKHHNVPHILNAYVQNIDIALDQSNKLQLCKQNECTELFNNPYKYIKE